MYFSRTFKALNFDFQIKGLSRTFKVRANPALKSLYCSLVRPTVEYASRVWNPFTVRRVTLGIHCIESIQRKATKS